MIQEQFVSYDIALKLKVLKFNQPCFAYYYSEIYKGEEQKQFRLHIIEHHDTINFPNYINEYEDFGLWYIQAPLFSQVYEFFRSKGIYTSGIDSCINDDEKIRIYFHHAIYNDKDECIFDTDDDYNTYEEAQTACINKLIELAHDK